MTAAIESDVLHDDLSYFRSNNTTGNSDSLLNPEKPTIVYIMFTAVQLSLASTGILASLLLLLGLYRDQKYLLIPWVLVLALFILVEITYCVFYFVEYTIRFNPIHAILFTLDTFVCLLNVYALLCVISQFQELKAGRGRLQDEQNQRIPNCIVYSAQPTATSYLSSKRPVTYNENRPTPTQSPTGPAPQICLAIEEPSNLVNRGPRKSVKFPDQDDSPPHNGAQLLEPWTIEVKSPKGADTAPLIEASSDSPRQPGV